MTVEQIEQRLSEIESLRLFWGSLMPDTALPSTAQCDRWLQIHTASHVLQGIRKAANKAESLHGEMDFDSRVRFTWSVANSLKRTQRP